MPKIINLVGQHIAVTKGSEIDPDFVEANGSPGMREVWTLVLTDKTYGDRHQMTFNKEVRDELVKQLTGGIVLAGGDLPKV